MASAEKESGPFEKKLLNLLNSIFVENMYFLLG
jgi:hypothetical protein